MQTTNGADDLLESARELLEAGRYDEMHGLCEQVLADFALHVKEYENEQEIGRFFSCVEEFSAYSHTHGLFANSQKDIVWLANAHAEAWFLRGFAYVEQEDFEAALTCLQEALELWPCNASYLCELAYCFERLGRNEEALGIFQTSLDVCRDTPHPEAIQMLDEAIRRGKSLFAEGQYDLANDMVETAEGLRSALRVPHRSVRSRAWRGVGFQCIELERWEEAEAAFLRSLELEPANGNALSELEYIERTRPRKRSDTHRNAEQS